MGKKNLLEFKGSGSTLFGLTIVNTILTVITLGIYYPWAKAKYLKYYYQNFYMSGDNFSFHGTGAEMFKGFIKAFIFIVVIVALYAGLLALKLTALGIIIYVLGCLVIAPIAMHGTMRYRMAKTSWRSIHFGYRGNFTDLMKMYFKGLGLTIITLGIYASWFEADLRAYIFKHIRFGNVRLGFDGTGTDLFIINLKGLILTAITLGIYSFWYMSELFNYYYRHTTAEHNGQVYRLNSQASGGKFFALQFVNMLIITFTLGLGFAWAQVRTMQFLAENIAIPEELDTDNIVQTETDFDDATGDSMFDFLDFDFIF
jgi:uncharacterized membrane protein YjgN (DUF898 family)